MVKKRRNVRKEAFIFDRFRRKKEKKMTFPISVPTPEDDIMGELENVIIYSTKKSGPSYIIPKTKWGEFEHQLSPYKHRTKWEKWPE